MLTKSAQQVSDLAKAISEQVKLTMEEEKLVETLNKRTSYVAPLDPLLSLLWLELTLAQSKERYVLYARRIVAFLCYLVVQASSWYVIILLTTQSSQMQARIAAKADFLSGYVSSLVPAVVTIINSLLPTIISLLTALERWDDAGFAIKAMVTRLYLTKILNVMIQLFSYALLFDPYLLTGQLKIGHWLTIDGARIRKNVMLEFKPSAYECRAEQVASALLTLVVTDFTVSKVMAISAPLAAIALRSLAAVWRFLQDRRRRRKRRVGVVVPLEKSGDEQRRENLTSEPLEPGKESPAPVETSLETDATELKFAGLEATAAENPSRRRLNLQSLKKSEFLVPQKMVALFYSSTIALVAIPLAPMTALLALLLHVFNFKFDKLVLMVRSLRLCCYVLGPNDVTWYCSTCRRSQ